MTMTKIHINLKQGVLEVEGSEEFVVKIFEDFKASISKKNFDALTEPEQRHESIDSNVTKNEPLRSSAIKKAKPTKGKSGSSDATLVKDLDLTGGRQKESLRDFCGKYVIKTNMERNLVFTYYLQNVLEIEDFGVNHIFTCYRNIPGTKIPGNLKQSLYDTSAKGWIAVKSIDNDISVPVLGVNHIEHDLPKTGDNML